MNYCIIDYVFYHRILSIDIVSILEEKYVNCSAWCNCFPKHFILFFVRFFVLKDGDRDEQDEKQEDSDAESGSD